MHWEMLYILMPFLTEIHFIFQCEPLRLVREKHQHCDFVDQPLHCDLLNDDSQVTQVYTTTETLYVSKHY